MTNKEQPFSLIDKKLLHLNKSLGQVETNANNEVIYNLKDHIRLNRGDQVTLYKSFVNERGLNAQTISLQQDYEMNWKFLYTIPADVKRIVDGNAFFYQEYLPYHGTDDTYNYYNETTKTGIGANGQPLVLCRLSSAIITNGPSPDPGLPFQNDYIIEPVFGTKRVFVEKDNYSVTSLGNIITDQLQGITLDNDEESDYIQENIRKNGGFTYQFYDDQLSLHIDLIDFNDISSGTFNFVQKQYVAFCNSEDPTEISPYLRQYLIDVCQNDKSVYLFADMNVYDKIVERANNGQHLYFYNDLHTLDASNVYIPTNYFFLPIQIPTIPADPTVELFGKPSYYAIGTKQCEINFDFNLTSRFFIDKLHQPCLMPNQTVADDSYPDTNTTTPGINNQVGQEFTKFYINSQDIIHGILPVDNTSAVEVLDFCSEVSSRDSDKKQVLFDCLVNFFDTSSVFFFKDDMFYEYKYTNYLQDGLFVGQAQISSRFPIPQGTKLVGCSTRANRYTYVFSATQVWIYDSTLHEWTINGALLSTDPYFNYSPREIKFACGIQQNSYAMFIFGDKYYWEIFGDESLTLFGLITDIINPSHPAFLSLYLQYQTLSNYLPVMIDGVIQQANIGFYENKAKVDFIDAQWFEPFPNGSDFDITSVFNGFQKTTFLSLPQRSIYWTYDEFFSLPQNATTSFEDSLMFRLGFSYGQIGDIQSVITRNKFPVLNTGITNNLKGITTRQQASLGLQLGTSGLGYSYEFTSGSNIKTVYNFEDVVGVFMSKVTSLSIKFQDNTSSTTTLIAIPGQTFSNTIINYFQTQIGSDKNWAVFYTDENGNSQIISPRKDVYAYLLDFNAEDQPTTFKAEATTGGDGQFPKYMKNPVLTFVQDNTTSNKNFIGIPVLTSSRPLDAQNLPDLLGPNNFYLIYSNLVNNNFYSANQGDKAGGIVGICSLQFAANDTLFSTESIQFTVNQTTILDQIMVRLTNPDGTSPPNEIINKNSAFIFIIETQVFPTS